MTHNPFPEMESDEDLTLRVKSGETAALGPILSRHQANVLNTAYKLLGDRDLAEDITQQTFLKVLTSAATFKPSHPFKTWLYTIVLNLCRDKLRAARRRTFLSLDAGAGGDSDSPLAEPADPRQQEPIETLQQRETARMIGQTLSSLPPDQKEALVLREFSDLSYEEIADMLKVSEKSVDSLLFRARKTLKERLLPYLRTGEAPQKAPRV